jgi:MoxR-like ATPase
MDALGKLIYINARGNQHETCTEGTRMEMLDGITQWATNANAEPMLALVDQAGTGKSTIAAHMTRKWEKEGSLLARFFFSKPSTVTANGFASTLAKDMKKSVPSLRPLVLAALKEHNDFSSCPLQQQLDWLVYTPLKSLNESRILVIDALDECSKADRAVLLNSTLDFITSSDAGSCPLKVLLTSRPEDDIVTRIMNLATPDRFIGSTFRCT